MARTRVTTSGGVGHLQKGGAVAFGDINNDGAQDIYAVMGGELPVIERKGLSL